MPALFDAIFISISLGHLIVDMLNGQRAVLLTYWSAQLNLTNTSLALVSTIYTWTASLSQPIFGWITDRLGSPRWMAAGGILWMFVLFSLALFLPLPYSIPCLILASLGSAAFHPAGTMQATQERASSQLAERETTSASWFFLFGQVGFFFGPILGGPLLDIFGPLGLLILSGAALPIGLNAGWHLRLIPSKGETGARLDSPARPINRRIFVVSLALVAALQAWAQQNMITFVPKYLSDLGQSAAVYGLVSGLFMGGSAVGNVIGGNLADRFGRQRVAMTMLALASVPLFMISRMGFSPWLYLLVPLSGALTGSVHSIVVVLAQRMLRGGKALASGLTLGFMFSAGALGTLLSGPLADSIGFSPVFQMTAGLVIIASILTLLWQENPGWQKSL